METYSDYGIEIPYRRTSGNVKCICPECKDTRGNPRDKSLSVNLDKGVWHCHHCGWSGGLKNKNFVPHFKPIREYRKPKPKKILPLSDKAMAWFNKRCISAQTVTDLKIREGMEFMPQVGKEMNTIQFQYFLDGELINVKYRTGNKLFKLEQGAELIPYNIDAIRDTPECIITEGEADCMSFWECGRHDVISVPNGANANLSYLDDFIDGWFEDKETIYVASDTDSKGILLKDELVRRFGADRCKIVTYGEGCKDANEHLVKYGKESLLQCLRNAKDVKVDGIFTVSDYENDLNNLYLNGMQQGLLTGHANFDKLCSFETKRLCVVTGVPGCLDGDTQVLMADGSHKEIRDIQVGDMVKAINNEYEEEEHKVITKWDSGEKQSYTLTTEKGKHIVATEIHKFLTFDGWKELKDITVNDYIAVESDIVPHNPYCINEDFLKLAAIWIAEGNKHTCSYVVSAMMPELIAEIKDIAKRNNLNFSNHTKGEIVIGTTPPLKMDKKRYISCISYYIRQKLGLSFADSVIEAEKRYNARLSDKVSKFSPYQRLKQLGLVGMTTNNIRLPKEFFQLAPDQTAILINYLFACDGCISVSGLEYCSNSQLLCEDISSLLSRFGISSYVSEKRVKYNGEYRITYCLFVSHWSGINQFCHRIGIIGKQTKLEKYLQDHKQSKRGDFLPASIKADLEHGSKYYKKNVGVYISKNDSSKVRINTDVVKACALFDHNYKLLNKISNNCRWEKVRSIEPVGIRHTYDIEVEGLHNFIANGMVTHNSGKSEIIDEICVRLNINYGMKTAFFSPENMPLAYHASKIIEKLVGLKLKAGEMPESLFREAKIHMEENFFHIMPPEGYTIANILDKAKYLIRKRGIKILVIDPYNRLESEQTSGKSETQYISEVLDKLTNFAQLNDMLVILMAHPRKIAKEVNEGIPTLYDINGSANFYNKADFGIIVHRKKEDNYTLVRVAKVKFRHLGETGDCKFKYCLQNGRYLPLITDTSNPEPDLRNYLDPKTDLLKDGTAQNTGISVNSEFLLQQTDECPF